MEHNQNNNTNLDFEKSVAQRNYEFYSSQCINKSKNAKKILEKIKDGYVPNEVDVFTLTCKDKKKILEYTEMMDIKNRVNDGKVTANDIAFLTEKAFGQTQQAQNLQNAFMEKGFIKE